jgi:hypothetical protein
MNEQLEKFALQAPLLKSYDYPDLRLVDDVQLERFAELIVQGYAEELRQLNEGERVVLPKDREHAQALVRVGMSYLEQNK